MTQIPLCVRRPLQKKRAGHASSASSRPRHAPRPLRRDGARCTWGGNDVGAATHTAQEPVFSLRLQGPEWGGKNQSTDVLLYCSPLDKAPRLEWDRAESSDSHIALAIHSETLCRNRHHLSTPNILGPVGRFIHFVFWMGLAAFALYLLGAMWANYTHYGARGWDLLPHRDFWRELPYTVRGALRHLSRVLLPDRGRGGYDPL